MVFVLEPEQAQAKEMARRYYADAAPVGNLRALRDSSDALGYSVDVWRGMADLGFPAAGLSLDQGGVGLGHVGLGAILEEGGRTLAASPLFATAALAANAIALTGTLEQRDRMLPQIAAGELRLALAFEEGSSHAPFTIATVARQDGRDYLLDGRKLFVVDGHSADSIIVTATCAGTQEFALFLVERQAAGVGVERLSMADSRNAAHVTLDSVRLPAAARLGAGGDARAVFEGVLDRGRACLAAEMLGSIVELFDRTLRYLGEREQFGVPIGSFQALKHRAAQMFVEIELTRSAVQAALAAIDADAADVAMLASLAKARANDTALLVSNEAIQMHGGIGVTDEMDFGLFLKRLRVAAQMLGSSSFHGDRYARLAGY
jgi:acyl-CoA dehydrogenase